MIEKRYYTINELSSYLSVPVNTLRWWVWQKQIPYQKFGRLIRFDKQEIEQWGRKSRVNIINN